MGAANNDDISWFKDVAPPNDGIDSSAPEVFPIAVSKTDPSSYLSSLMAPILKAGSVLVSGTGDVPVRVKWSVRNFSL